MLEFDNLFVAGVPLVLIIAGLVAFAKTMGLSGKWLTALSLALGTLLGIGYRLTFGVPTEFTGWFGTVIFGLGLGIVTSGLYDLVKRDVLKQPV